MEKTAGYSKKCGDPTARWDRNAQKCVPCHTEAGHEVTPNCGYDDDGGLHEAPMKVCAAGTFNDDHSSAVCRRCTACPPGTVVSECTSTADAQCRLLGTQKTKVPYTTNQASTSTPRATTPMSSTFSSASSSDSAPLWAVPLAVFVSILVLSACMIFMKRKRGQLSVPRYRKNSSITKEGFSRLATIDGNSDLEHILSPDILSAPLQTVLDNLDVLEELVILLDPESHGVKSTKHLASHCSFPSTWVTYTYSMKDTKSPLKAVLEGVTSRHPDWTIEHLAKLLRSIERNDAVTVLAKLGAKTSQHVAADCLREV